MSRAGGFKSKFQKGKKTEVESKREDDDQLYYRINRKTGRVETNFLEWERSWKNVKILQFPARYAEELRSGQRGVYTAEQILARNVMLPEVDTAREYWQPTPEQTAELTGLTARARETKELEFYLPWRQERLLENARRKAQNEITKTRIDLETKVLQERQDTIGKLMGDVLADLTKASLDKIEKYVKPAVEEPAQAVAEGVPAPVPAPEPIRTLEEARQRGDWLFIFEAARATHLDAGAEDDLVLRFEKRKQEEDYLSKLKHTQGDFNRWITKFEDQVKVCENIGVVLTEEAKVFYFMNNLNDTIFGTVKANFMELSTRVLFPESYDEIKQRIIAEYGQIISRKPQTVLKVIKGEDAKRYGEASFKAEEEGCYVCGMPGHFYRSCKHYNKDFSVEANRKYFLKNQNKKEKKRGHEEEKTSNDRGAPRGGGGGGGGGHGNNNRGGGGRATNTTAQGGATSSDTRAEQARFARELDMDGIDNAHLDAEEMSLVCRCDSGTIDLLLDTGTVSNLVPEDRRDVVQDIRNEHTSLLGVGGARVLATETGEAGVFGKSRIVPGSGAICISQRQFGDKFQMINPHKDLVILRGWPRTEYAGREYHFTRDEGDQLLHCRLKATSEMAMLAKGVSFYRPDEMPTEGQGKGLDKLIEIRRFHEYYSHPSINEMKRMAERWFKDSGITHLDIEDWHSKEGKFCAGCLEGKLKEHARRASTKPLTANRPGENGVADLMFIEGRHEVKTPMYIHVDVATKLIIGYSLKNKTYGEVHRAIEYVDEQHKLMGKKLERLTFDRESAIVVMQDDIEAMGIKLSLKAAGQKVGLAEVSIRLIREKARATKAGVRAMFGYMPANQFNVDLCLDTISVLNRTKREGQMITPYEMFSGDGIDYERDFRCRWGELVIVKKPKGISSDLRVTGEWAMVVRRLMNHTGVIKVYLIGTRKYAYRLKFKRATVPEWVIIAMNSIGDQSIGFEDEAGAEDLTNIPATGELSHVVGLLEDIEIDQEADPEEQEIYGAGEIDDAIRALEEAEPVQEEPSPGAMETRAQTNPDRFRLEQDAERYAEYVAMGWREPEAQDVGKVVFNRAFRRTEANLIRARETLKQAFLSRHEGGAEREAANIVYEEAANIYFDEAMKTRPNEAWDALLKEILKGDSKRIWHGELMENLTEEERRLILPMMKNYIEKYTPAGDFEKAKARVLVRGDLQKSIGETQGPVSRTESILILISIAIYHDLEVYKIDITAAYLNTPMNDDVKHKWLMLDKDVAKVLMSMDGAYWRTYLRRDGKILVKLDKIMYGFKEAAYWWNVTLTKVFLENGYKQMGKDKCVFVKGENNKVSYCAITVDDCFFAATRDEEWIQSSVDMLKRAFDELTLERGDVINILGMTVHMERDKGRAVIKQKRFVDKLKEEFQVAKSAITPATADLLYEREDSELMRDQKKFMSLNATLMYASKRTYPEISFPVVYLASKYNKATDDDYGKAMRIAEYIVGCGDEHCLILAPKSLQLVARSDASYAEHKDGRSHTGGCIGFESDTACWFMWVSSKQPVVALSTCESELIATSTIGCGVEWGRQFLQELGHVQLTIEIGVDNKCSMHLLEQGTGSFKRAKHIKVRYFWLKDLIDEEEIVLKYIPSEELVADLLTKAITGAKFKYLRAKLLGEPNEASA